MRSRQHRHVRAGASTAELDRQRRLVEEMGGQFHEVAGADVAAALVDFAQAENATQLVLGSSRQSRWAELTRGSVINRIVRCSGTVDVHVISDPARRAARAAAPDRAAAGIAVVVAAPGPRMGAGGGRRGPAHPALVQVRTVLEGPAGEIRLTPIEWHLVEVLVRNAGKLVTARQLLEEVWGRAYGRETNYLRVHFAHIRRKLEPEPSRPRYFITEPGMGYRFETVPQHDLSW